MSIGGKMFLIVGSSGVGKGTVISALKKSHGDFVFPVSCTTRAPRPHEKNGEFYLFVSKEEFKEKIENGEFLEWAVVHEDEYYGMLKKPIMEALEQGKIVVREADIQGFESIRKILPKENLVSIFLYAKSWEILKNRILKRGPTSENELEQRRRSFEKEKVEGNECDYQVESVEGGIPQCVAEVEGIIEGRIC